jgi:hypothetical protein
VIAVDVWCVACGCAAQTMEKSEIMDAAHSLEFRRLFEQFIEHVGRRGALDWSRARPPPESMVRNMGSLEDCPAEAMIHHELLQKLVCTRCRCSRLILIPLPSYSSPSTSSPLLFSSCSPPPPPYLPLLDLLFLLHHNRICLVLPLLLPLRLLTPRSFTSSSHVPTPPHS